ncbi:hypothetical protein [Conexibacter sp. SYSU D00693]|uniref:hypothetical protein n=1 Tax=Conexibacter sp. SYSU D00693 TaxID=2812560 RepID=UPI00196A6B3A|nr:hypothetical protein [Conexibacter sp. SYSU D00693]
MPTTADLAHRVVLVAEKERATGTEAKIRRYRLARLQLERRDERFAHLRRSHD